MTKTRVDMTDDGKISIIFERDNDLEGVKLTRSEALSLLSKLDATLKGPVIDG